MKMIYIIVTVACTKVTKSPKSAESIRNKQNITYVSKFVPELSAFLSDERAKSDHQKKMLLQFILRKILLLRAKGIRQKYEI